MKMFAIAVAGLFEFFASVPAYTPAPALHAEFDKKCLYFSFENSSTVPQRVRFHHFHRENFGLFRLGSHNQCRSWGYTAGGFLAATSVSETSYKIGIVDSILIKLKSSPVLEQSFMNHYSGSAEEKEVAYKLFLELLLTYKIPKSERAGILDGFKHFTNSAVEASNICVDILELRSIIKAKYPDGMIYKVDHGDTFEPAPSAYHRYTLDWLLRDLAGIRTSADNMRSIIAFLKNIANRGYRLKYSVDIALTLYAQYNSICRFSVFADYIMEFYSQLKKLNTFRTVWPEEFAEFLIKAAMLGKRVEFAHYRPNKKNRAKTDCLIGEDPADNRITVKLTTPSLQAGNTIRINASN